MIQIFHSNLVIVDLVKRPFERPKSVRLCPINWIKLELIFQRGMVKLGLNGPHDM